MNGGIVASILKTGNKPKTQAAQTEGLQGLMLKEYSQAPLNPFTYWSLPFRRALDH